MELVVGVVLPSGNHASYAVDPVRLAKNSGTDPDRWAIDLGRQVAHERDGWWYEPGGWKAMAGSHPFHDVARNAPDVRLVKDAFVAALQAEAAGAPGAVAAAYEEIHAAAGSHLVAETHASNLLSLHLSGQDDCLTHVLASLRLGIPCTWSWTDDAPAIVLLLTPWQPQREGLSLALLKRYIGNGGLKLDRPVRMDAESMDSTNKTNYQCAEGVMPLKLAFTGGSGRAVAALLEAGALAYQDFRQERGFAMPGDTNLAAFARYAEAMMAHQPKELAHVTEVLMKLRVTETRVDTPSSSAMPLRRRRSAM